MSPTRPVRSGNLETKTVCGPIGRLRHGIAAFDADAAGRIVSLSLPLEPMVEATVISRK